MKPDFGNCVLKYTCGLPSQLPSDGLPQVALSGRSNVGKSSLLNALLGRKKLARVSATPGKTVTINYYACDGKLYLVDLPGYGYAKRSGEEKRRFASLADRYLADSRNSGALRLVVQLVDMRIGPTTDDNTMLSYLQQSGIPCLLVATKADKLNKTEYTKMRDALQTHPLLPEGTKVIPFSALRPTAAEEIRREILAAIF